MPLAQILRPSSLEEFIGQEHLVGEGKPLKISIDKGHVFSIIFWGPPGVGKTTLARIIAKSHNREFFELSAVSAGKKDIQNIIAQIDSQGQTTILLPPIVFLDEIHRFNKAQQDYLLPFVEEGKIVLIGATTENPSFEVISALLSRTKVFTLQQLSSDDLRKVIDRAVSYLQGESGQNISLEDDSLDWLINFSAGDARKLLNLIEHTFQLYNDLSLEHLKSTLQTSAINYDKGGEEHYDTISAFIKSMRASNIDAALYYLARMVSAGEDPKFIARRMVIFASEDIGLAAPTALVVANAVFDAVTKVGYPEAQINLAHGVAYLANCKKNRSAYDAYFSALADVEKFGNLPIPMELRNAPTKLMKNLGYGKGYDMYPDSSHSLLPTKIKKKKYFST